MGRLLLAIGMILATLSMGVGCTDDTVRIQSQLQLRLPATTSSSYLKLHAIQETETIPAECNEDGLCTLDVEPEVSTTVEGELHRVDGFGEINSTQWLIWEGQSETWSPVPGLNPVLDLYLNRLPSVELTLRPVFVDDGVEYDWLGPLTLHLTESRIQQSLATAFAANRPLDLPLGRSFIIRYNAPHDAEPSLDEAAFRESLTLVMADSNGVVSLPVGPPPSIPFYPQPLALLEYLTPQGTVDLESSLAELGYDPRFELQCTVSDHEECQSDDSAWGSCSELERAVFGDGSIVQIRYASISNYRCGVHPVVVACGDGVIMGSELCDDAGESTGCNDDCTLAGCGDGVTNTIAGEQCDDGAESASCNTNCTVASCGDGVLNIAAGEVCDDDNDINTDGCAACQPARCGDSYVLEGTEDCDDGGENTATCDADCTEPVCGDGFLNQVVGEVCDGGSSAVASHLCTSTCQENGNFVSVWYISEVGETITLPLVEGFDYDFTVLWGGEGTAAVTSSDDPDKSHTFETSGWKLIEFQGSVSTLRFGETSEAAKIFEVYNLGSLGWTSFESMFADCVNLTTVDAGDTSSVASMESMFAGAVLAQPDTSGWDTSNVSTMKQMFKNATAANPDVSNWDTTNVSDMHSMFEEADSAEPDVSDWSTDNVTTMEEMFLRADLANPDVSQWNTEKVTNMRRVFKGTKLANPDVATWDTSSVITMQGMFAGSDVADPDVSLWQTYNVQSMEAMFERASVANPDVSDWNITEVTTLDWMFYLSVLANPDVSDWQTGTVISMEGMFSEAFSANPNVSNWNTSSLESARHMFSEAPNANPDLSSWEVAGITSFSSMLTDSNISVENYSNFLMRLAEQNQNTDVSLGAGTTLYNEAGRLARNLLLNERSWAITDGGTTDEDSDGLTYDDELVLGSNPSVSDTDGEGLSDGDEHERGTDPNVPDTDGDGVTDYMEVTAGTDPLGNCGDGIVTGLEVCDDPSGSTCSSDCQTDYRFLLNFQIDSAGDSITLPLVYGFDYNFTVSWGDGSSSTVTSYDDEDRAHTYGIAGSYTVSITGLMEAISFYDSEDRDKLISVPNLGSMGWTNLQYAFRDCGNLTSVAGGDTSNVTSLRAMFKDSPLVEVDTSSWDTSNVIYMQNMFGGASLANPDTSNWDTGQVQTMRYMFYRATAANPDTSNWDTSNVTSMAYMFRQAEAATPNTTGWQVSNVTDMSYMFSLAPMLNPDVSSWNTANVETLEGMFQGAVLANPDVANWETGSVTKMEKLFDGASVATPNTSSWSTENVETMAMMFHGASIADPDTSNWDTSSVTDMDNMFRQATVAQPDTTNWNTSNVVSMSGMFMDSASSNPNTGNWDTSSVTNMAHMFSGATSANPDTSTWDTSSVTTMLGMFSGATSANPDVRLWDISNVTAIEYMFNGALSAIPDTSEWDPSSATSMDYLFAGAISAAPDMSGWNLTSITSMYNMLEGIDIGTENYSSFLMQLLQTNNQIGLELNGGSAQYNAAGAEARAVLISERGWIITDGGPNF